jgi:hypothetical protein
METNNKRHRAALVIASLDELDAYLLRRLA